VEYLKEKFGKKISVIARKDNGGFAVANNEGIKASHGEFILLLNSDTIVRADALTRVVSEMNVHQEVGIASVRLENPDGSFQPQGGALPTLVNIAAWWLWPGRLWM
jgi:GT2 family glycosyltransferase